MTMGSDAKLPAFARLMRETKFAKGEEALIESAEKHAEADKKQAQAAA